MPPASDHDRATVDRMLKAYGSAYEKGLAVLEKDFDVAISRTRRRFDIDLTLRAFPKVRYGLRMSADGALQFNERTLPDAPEATDEQRAAADARLKAIDGFWMLYPLNGELLFISTRGGLDGLAAGFPTPSSVHRDPDPDEQARTTLLWLDGHVVIYNTEGCWDPMLCIRVDPNRDGIRDATWVDEPMSTTGRYLPPDEVEWIQRALQHGGDFGVYGSVSASLEQLLKTFEIMIEDLADRYCFRCRPHDGHGHRLLFQIHKETGRIVGAAAGHYTRKPPRRPRD